MQRYCHVNTKTIDLNDNEIPFHRELLGPSHPNPMDSNDEETPVHRDPLRFSTPKPFEQGKSFSVIREIAALTVKEKPISSQKNRRVRRRVLKAPLNAWLSQNAGLSGSHTYFLLLEMN